MWFTKHKLKARLALRISTIPHNYYTIAEQSKPIQPDGLVLLFAFHHIAVNANNCLNSLDRLSNNIPGGVRPLFQSLMQTLAM